MIWLTERRTDRRVDHNTPHPYRGGVINKAFIDIRLHPGIATPLVAIRPITAKRDVSHKNRKYITYRNAAGGGPRHGHRGSAQNISRRSIPRFQRYARGQTDTRTDKPIAILISPTDRGGAIRVCIQHMYHEIITEELGAFVNKLSVIASWSEIVMMICFIREQRW